MARVLTKSHAESKDRPKRSEAGQLARKNGKQAPALAEQGKAGVKRKARSREGDGTSSLFEPLEGAFVKLYEAPVLARIELVKSLGAHDAKFILGQLRVPRGEALAAFRLPAATVNRKAKNKAPLSPAESERVLGFGRLLGQVQTMVRESGDLTNFDASDWLSTWMSSPVAALNGARPLDLMDTMTGQALVSQLLSQMQSGAYA